MKTTGYFKGLFTADELDHTKISVRESYIVLTSRDGVNCIVRIKNKK